MPKENKKDEIFFSRKRTQREQRGMVAEKIFAERERKRRKIFSRKRTQREQRGMVAEKRFLPKENEKNEKDFSAAKEHRGNRGEWLPKENEKDEKFSAAKERKGKRLLKKIFSVPSVKQSRPK